MIHTFRVDNGLGSPPFDELFIYKAELLRENLGPEDTVVFVDDFVGTGDQVIEAWTESLGELLPNRPRAFLILVAAVEDARRRIARETLLTARPFRYLRARDNFFASECTHFRRGEKERILAYCKRADSTNPPIRKATASAVCWLSWLIGVGTIPFRSCTRGEDPFGALFRADLPR
jgi:hypothetical protein